jgi:hypothetical protein
VFCINHFYINIFEFWNESSEFPLFLMGKFTLIYEFFGLQAHFQNELCSQTKVPLYFDFLERLLVLWSRTSCPRLTFCPADLSGYLRLIFQRHFSSMSAHCRIDHAHGECYQCLRLSLIGQKETGNFPC